MSSGVQAARPAGSTSLAVRFVARQPILTADEKVLGYELLFRDGLQNSFPGGDLEKAARTTVDNSLLVGLDVLCHGRLAFINCPRDLLMKEYVFLLPAKHAVLEILESVDADSEVIAACEKLKAAGYQIALDDFVPRPENEALIELADIIKADLRISSRQDCQRLVDRFGKTHKMLAEKVETWEEFNAMKQMGFACFQGYFFREPELLQARDIPSNAFHYILMLQEVSKAEIEIKEVEKLIKCEASICYRLLRYLNSPIFGLAAEIHSVRHALSMLGENEIRRWVRLVAALGAGQSKCTELVTSALTRARFCELIGSKVPHGNSDLFLMGLMSLMNVILEMPMEEVLARVPLDIATKDALLSRPSPLREIFRLMLAQDSGEWDAAIELAGHMRLDPRQVSDAQWEAIEWAQEVNQI
jgi:EAL and modified HD-GYP domain-containing signal transduction protein